MDDKFKLYLVKEGLKRIDNLGSLSPIELEEKIRELESVKPTVGDFHRYCILNSSLDKIEEDFWVNDRVDPIIFTDDYISSSFNLLKNSNKILLSAGAGINATGETYERWSVWKELQRGEDISSRLDIDPPPVYNFLKEMLTGKDYFVFASNVDDLFVKAGFDKDRIYQCHGNYKRRQCSMFCKDIFYSNRCPSCKEKGRPNVLLYGDKSFNHSIVDIEEKKMEDWIRGDEPILILEIGAGIHIPTIRDYSESLLEKSPLHRLIRVNPIHPYVEGKGSDRILFVPIGVQKWIESFK